MIELLATWWNTANDEAQALAQRWAGSALGAEFDVRVYPPFLRAPRCVAITLAVPLTAVLVEREVAAA